MAKGACLGQHFLTAHWAAVSLARAANIQGHETILEIGPGKGMLTRELLATGANVIAIEKDELLVARLHEVFAQEISRERLEIISADIRDITPEKLFLQQNKYILAANIPYYITGEIIRQFLTASAQPRAMALLVQKEVAQRITSKRESILSLSVKAYGIPKIIEKVSRTCFSPAPSVDSAILLIDNISRNFFTDLDEEQFFAIIHAGFASKRKFVANNLGVKYGKENATRALAAADVNEKERAENISLEQWKLIAQSLIDSLTDNFLADARKFP
jgi:16S rRNA (adenine1518-N6/adenine1519-N6)-dimethyltransferase